MVKIVKKLPTASNATAAKKPKHAEPLHVQLGGGGGAMRATNGKGKADKQQQRQRPKFQQRAQQRADKENQVRLVYMNHEERLTDGNL